MKEKTSSQVNSEEHEVEPDEQNKREEQDDVLANANSAELKKKGLTNSAQQATEPGEQQNRVAHDDEPGRQSKPAAW